MLAPPDNDALVIDVLAQRFSLPLQRLEPGRVDVSVTRDPRLLLRGFTQGGGAVVTVVPRHLEAVRARLVDPDTLERPLAELAPTLGGELFSGVSRTGVDIALPEHAVSVLDVGDPRLPAWVLGHFTGSAWCVLDEDASVLSTAVLKRYDDRLREIAVGTAARARGRGLARSTVAAAARAVLADGRAVLYNHTVGNSSSARVAEAVGLYELGRFHTIMPARPGGAAGDPLF